MIDVAPIGVPGDVLLAMNYEKLAEVVVAVQHVLLRHVNARGNKGIASKPQAIISLMMLEDNFVFMFPGCGPERRRDGSYRAISVSKASFFGLLARVMSAPHRLVGENGTCCYAIGPIKASLSARVKLSTYDHARCGRCMYDKSLEGTD